MSLTTRGNAMWAGRLPSDYCGWCSNPPNHPVYHFGPCPRVRALEYHSNGRLKRVEFRGEREPVSIEVNFDWTHRAVPDGYAG